MPRIEMIGLSDRCQNENALTVKRYLLTQGFRDIVIRHFAEVITGMELDLFDAKMSRQHIPYRHAVNYVIGRTRRWLKMNPVLTHEGSVRVL